MTGVNYLRRAARRRGPNFLDHHQDHIRRDRDWRGNFFAPASTQGKRVPTFLAGCRNGRWRHLSALFLAALAAGTLGLRWLGGPEPGRPPKSKTRRKNFPSRAWSEESDFVAVVLSALSAPGFVLKVLPFDTGGGLPATSPPMSVEHIKGGHRCELDHLCHGSSPPWAP